MIVTIVEKSVSDQMDTSLLTIPTIVTIPAIARIGSGSTPVIASVIVTIVNDRNDHYGHGASDRKRSERSSHLPRCAAVPFHFMLILTSRQKKKRFWEFFERLERLNGYDSAIVERSQGLTIFG